jgi:uncharacterized protein
LTALPYPKDGDSVRLLVRVTPRARKSAIEGVVATAGDRPALAVRLAAPPVVGAANRALVELLARRLGIAESRIAIVAGERSRLKTVRISQLEPGVLAALTP